MALNSGRSADPSVTEVFIAHQEGVVEANVWPGRNGSLLCRVLVAEDCNMGAKDIQQLCLQRLGREATPTMVMVDKVKRLAA